MSTPLNNDEDIKKKQPFYKGLFFQIIMAIVAGILIGYLWPNFGAALQPLATGFIKLIKMIISPLIFGVIVVGIAKVGDVKSVGRIGLKTIVYFEIITTLALIVGMVAANLISPGSGMAIDVSTLSQDELNSETGGAEMPGGVEFIMNIIPESVFSAFADNSLLQVLLFSLMFGFALLLVNEKQETMLLDALEQFNEVIFKIVGFIMKLAVPATFGAIAFSVGEYGLETLVSFAKLIGAAAVATIVFLVIISIILRIFGGVNLVKLILYFREEIVLAFATGSSEAVMPRTIKKLEDIGCERAVVGLVVPTGYSFNLDGASIYLAVSIVFLAQVTGANMSFVDQLIILGILLLTSNGMAGVPGSAFVALSATAAATGFIPVAAVALMLAPDRFMGAMRTTTNLVGNIVATIIVARWEKMFDIDQARWTLSNENRHQIREQIAEKKTGGL
ncbi:cation:dicarboxylase symporter family transporter [Virgibacillus sp. NKC19-3]|uniref:cation:dicarboxylate symporter family transporter n=1 Tax=Virgibacillus saliphilus TaxID=2831674 RepID=UPI001C9A3DFD|nr:cation:dicarboxylase symporter family transporter [Virgibacillus sp. NKC19-3]MBY7144206.1 cation:dicarboxylase symporter family transporter [Virgibacillus sp. NKC19-3]